MNPGEKAMMWLNRSPLGQPQAERVRCTINITCTQLH
jgi:hypothetical protein